MAYGVTDTGFIRKTFDQSKSELETNWKNRLGQDQDLSEDSPNAIIIGLVAEMADQLWATAEDSYNSLNRNTAEAVPLDNTLALIGIERNDESPSTANVSFKGDNITTIPANTQVKQSTTAIVFKTTASAQIKQTACNWIQFQINTVSNTTVYRFYIDGNAYSYTSDGTATEDEIADGIKTVIEAAAIGLGVTNEGSGLITIEATDKDDSYDIAANSLLTVGKVQSIIAVECLLVGENEVPIGSINEISTAVAGLDSVYNYSAGETGTAIETDQEARLRGQTDPAVSGFSFTDAIKAKVVDEVAGVSYCRVYENDDIVTDANSIPAKSWEAVIVGGSSTNIGALLYRMKIAGMRSYGSETVVVKDSDDIPHNIRYTRPDNLYFWLKVTINSYNSEEDFPADGEAAIKAAMLSFANDYFNIGDNVILQKFYKPVFEVEGLGDVTIEMDATAATNDTPVYASANINCTIRQIPNFDLSRMTVVL